MLFAWPILYAGLHHAVAGEPPVVVTSGPSPTETRTLPALAERHHPSPWAPVVCAATITVAPDGHAPEVVVSPSASCPEAAHRPISRSLLRWRWSVASEPQDVGLQLTLDPPEPVAPTPLTWRHTWGRACAGTWSWASDGALTPHTDHADVACEADLSPLTPPQATRHSGRRLTCPGTFVAHPDRGARFIALHNCASALRPVARRLIRDADWSTPSGAPTAWSVLLRLNPAHDVEAKAP